MPLALDTGVHYALHGPADGVPLLVGLPLFASFDAIFGAELAPVLPGYLDRLTDRYRVLLVDYPSIGGSRDVPPDALTVERICSDLLGTAAAAGFERFAYWGHSWGGAMGLQLAVRSDRLTALVVGGWPPLGGPYAAILAAARLKAPAPEASSLKVLRSPAQYRQWITCYASLEGWDEAAAVHALRLPRMALWGADGDLVEAGIPVPIASINRARRAELEALGWTVHEVPGQGHGVCLQPELVVPPVRAFLDAHLTQ
ncbi:MAG: alpha/beta fold hydrolase [Rubrivivax sp.]|nr:alpha/beta fold hydrolase [Rubrivivax sp.]